MPLVCFLVRSDIYYHILVDLFRKNILVDRQKQEKNSEYNLFSEKICSKMMRKRPTFRHISYFNINTIFKMASIVLVSSMPFNPVNRG
jgi:hypothetical protein